MICVFRIRLRRRLLLLLACSPLFTLPASRLQLNSQTIADFVDAFRLAIRLAALRSFEIAFPVHLQSFDNTNVIVLFTSPYGPADLPACTSRVVNKNKNCNIADFSNLKERTMLIMIRIIAML